MQKKYDSRKNIISMYLYLIGIYLEWVYYSIFLSYLTKNIEETTQVGVGGVIRRDREKKN